MERNKYIGICKVGEKGQIVIPKEIRNMFNINPGDSIIVLSDKEKGQIECVQGLLDSSEKFTRR